MRAQQSPRRPGFFGRDHALSELRAALDGAHSQRGGLILLVGESGMGKTWTAEQLAGLAADDGFSILWGRCHEEGAPPYWPWIQALRSLAEDAAPLLADCDAAAVGALLDRLDGSLSTTDHGPQTTPESARFRLFDAVTALLKRAARHQPILIVFDDLHEADASSLHLLAFLARGLARSRILVAATCRLQDAAPRRSPFTILGGIPLQTIPLGGLDYRAVDRLMTEALGQPPSRALLRSVMGLTEGNPFFATEIARWLVHEPGALADATGSVSVPVPDSVRAVIVRRLDQLTASTRTLLSLAAVLGRHFDDEHLRTLWPEGRTGALLEMLDEALRLQILQEGPGERHYRFHHALTRHLLYEELEPSVRTRLHARVAGMLEAEYAAGAEHLAHELAYHCGRARPLIGADHVVRYARAAGERDLAAHAYDEAASHFERALAGKVGSPFDAETAALHYGLGCARAAVSRRWNRQDAWEHLRRAAEEFLRTGAIDRAVDAVTHAAITPEAVTGVADTIERVREAVPPASAEAGWLLARQAAARYFETGDYAAARRTFATASAIAQRTADDALTLRTLALQTSVDHFDLRWTEAQEKSRRVIDLARTIDDPHAETYARYRLAYAFAFTGRAAEAREEARLNLAGAERLGDLGLLEDALFVNAALAQLSGDWGSAREFGARGLDIAPHHLALLHLRVLLEAEVGEAETARAYLARLIQAATHAGPYPLREAFQAVVLPQLALLGIAPVPFASPLNEPSANPNVTAMLAVARALGAVQASDVEEATRAHRLLAPRSGSILAPLLVTARLLGLLQHAAGKLDQAAAHFATALEFCRGAGYTPELAWTCHDYARSLLARDQPGDCATAGTLLREAEKLATDLEMRPLHTRVLSMQHQHQTLLDRQSGALTPREVSVMRLLASGKTNQEIARDLYISAHTVAAHVAHILAKTGCKNRTEAATYATRALLADPAPRK